MKQQLIPYALTLFITSHVYIKNYYMFICEVRQEIKHNLKSDIHILPPFIPQKLHCNTHTIMCMDIRHVEDTEAFQ